MKSNLLKSNAEGRDSPPPPESEQLLPPDEREIAPAGGVPVHADEHEGDLVTLAGLSLVAGALAGLVGAVFRLLLVAASRFRTAVILESQGGPLSGFLFFVCVCASAVALAVFLVRKYAPSASGSGIPHVEAVVAGEIPPDPGPFLVIAVKFVGGLLAIGAGLALGREGPSVQLGASVSHLVGRTFRRSWPDCRVLIAAGAGAGLATAFNAPIAGAAFVLEELVRRFEPRIAVTALGASASAISLSRALLGDILDFQVPPLPDPHVPPDLLYLAVPLYFLFGGVAGLAAIFYNRTMIGALDVAASFDGRKLMPNPKLLGAAVGVLGFFDFGLGVLAAVAALLYVLILERQNALAGGVASGPAELRAWLAGAIVACLAWNAPWLVGGGDNLTQSALNGVGSLAILPLLFLARLELGAASYAAGTPGGIFAPLLVLGAQLGLAFGLIVKTLLPGLETDPVGFALVGMAAFFTGVVRAPLTGMVLVSEMTGSFGMLLPMLGACCVAFLVPSLLRSEPIYDSLRERTVRGEKAFEAGAEPGVR